MERSKSTYILTPASASPPRRRHGGVHDFPRAFHTADRTPLHVCYDAAVRARCKAKVAEHIVARIRTEKVKGCRRHSIHFQVDREFPRFKPRTTTSACNREINGWSSTQSAQPPSFQTNAGNPVVRCRQKRKLRLQPWGMYVCGGLARFETLRTPSQRVPIRRLPLLQWHHILREIEIDDSSRRNSADGLNETHCSFVKSHSSEGQFDTSICFSRQA